MASVLGAEQELILIVHYQVPAGMTVGRSHINTSRGSLVIQVTILSFPLSFTVTVVVSGLVDTAAVLPTWIVQTFVSDVHLAVGAGGSRDAVTPEAGGGGHTGPPIVAEVLPADVVSSEVTLRPRVSFQAGALVACAVLVGAAVTSVQAGVVGTEILPLVTVPSPPAWLAVALIVVQELDTVSSAIGAAGVGETLVDISLTSLPSEA